MSFKTSDQFEEVVVECRDIFSKKMKDYGSAWRILRAKSITDQIFIKAQRIRSFEEKGIQKIDEGIRGEYIGIINYSVIAMINQELGFEENQLNLEIEKGIDLYNKYIYTALQLMENKNHDYSEAWRDMRLSSLTDIILMKLFRIKQIEDNKGKTFISEGVDANYLDIINYAVFALIKLNEKLG